MLTDSHGRFHSYLRISLTERCNLRCVYCMPAEGVVLQPREHILSFEEIERLARIFAAHGVTKLRLTGGEPLVRKGVVDLAARLSALPGIHTLAITTNGIGLERQLDDLLASGVNAFNISLDTLRDDRFEQITRRPGLSKVRSAIDRLVQLGVASVKINCVVMRGVNDDELVDFVDMTKDQPVEVRFIEFMPFDGNGWDRGEFMSFTDQRQVIEDARGDLIPLQGSPTDTARVFSLSGYHGTMGFITSMSALFCGGCNRLRLTADGNLKVCLFGAGEVSLRDAMRNGASDQRLEELIAGAVQRKAPHHAGMDLLKETPNRPMILIGG